MLHFLVGLEASCFYGHRHIPHRIVGAILLVSHKRGKLPRSAATLPASNTAGKRASNLYHAFTFTCHAHLIVLVGLAKEER